jgi:predicted acyl esterase
MKRYRWLLSALVALTALVVAPAAQAAPAEIFGGDVECEPVVGGITECNGPTLTFDGTKIDVNVFLPPESLGSGPFPLIGDFHGWGGSKQGLKTEVLEAPVEGKATPTSEVEDPRIRKWAEEGYAVFSMSDRGWGLSCGAKDPDATEPECEQGWNHLMDDRYEVRDAQYLMSVLADEGIVQPKRIGVTGVSYGGGLSVQLAALRNREMEANGTLVPWQSPEGVSMEIAAAAPQWAWTDIAYALAPNGRNLDYVTNSTYRGPAGNFPIGVMKYSYTEGLYKTGAEIGRYSPGAEDSIPLWRERLRGGEPYTDAFSNQMIKELTTFHSAFGIDSSVAPAPMVLQSGWNDDLFPVDEALRLYERTRAQYPGDPISLFLADYGHSRSQNKAADVAAFNARLEAWFAHYLKGEGAAPSSSVEALTTTCPKSAPSEGPFTAADWSGLQPGEIRLNSSTPQTIGHRSLEEEQAPTTSSGAFDPIVGTGSPCTALPSAAVANPKAVTYDLGAAPGSGYTLMGSPTIIANVQAPSPNSEIAARLLDVSPEGTERLVARGLYRPVGGVQQMVFQLHPQGYHFAAGHVARLELLPSDFPYGRFSNLQTNITVSSLEMRLPVLEQPGALGGLVQAPAAKVVPAGYTLAPEFVQKVTPPPPPAPAPTPPAPAPVKVGEGGLVGQFNAYRKAAFTPVHCTGEGPCSGRITITIGKLGKKGRLTLAKGSYTLPQGATKWIRMPLTKNGRKVIEQRMENRKGARSVPGVVRFYDSGRPTVTRKRPIHVPKSH